MRILPRRNGFSTCHVNLVSQRFDFTVCRRVTSIIQSRFLNRFSFLESAKRLHDLIGDYPRVAIGTVCKCRKLDFILYCCKVARKAFPHSWIHAFGLTLKAVPRVAHLINSFDSLACYFPRLKFREWCEKTGLRPFPNASPSSSRSETARFFWNQYLNRLKQLVYVEGV